MADQPEEIATRVKLLLAEFISDAVPVGADGQVSRAAERFALVAAAGELATDAGITGWEQGAAIEAAKTCLNAWMAHRGGTGSHEDAEIIERLKETLTRDAARFEPLACGQSNKARDRLGFIGGGMPTEEMIYLITVSGWKEMFKGLNHNRAAEVLKTQGIIKHELGNGLPRRALPGLGRSRCYEIRQIDLPE